MMDYDYCPATHHEKWGVKLGSNPPSLTSINNTLTLTPQVIPFSASCNTSDSAAVWALDGAAEVTDLGPGDSVGATAAQFEMAFSHAGAFKICYKLAGGTYEEVGAVVFMVNATAPTAFTYDGEIKVGAPQVFTMSGGAGLQLGQQKDVMKAVHGADSCLGSAAGGTSIDTDLGPNDADGATDATCQFTWRHPGRYQLCYRTWGGNYTKAQPNRDGSQLIVTLTLTPTLPLDL